MFDGSDKVSGIIITVVILVGLARRWPWYSTTATVAEHRRPTFPGTSVDCHCRGWTVAASTTATSSA